MELVGPGGIADDLVALLGSDLLRVEGWAAGLP
jgi:hypothetical protein